MAENETEISTPVETPVEDTSANVEPENTDTSTPEPETDNVTAETETKTDEQAEKLFAGKYKTVEEFEKGYKALESKLGQPNEYEQKYNELLAKEAERQRQIRFNQQQTARQRGFDSPEEAQIADNVQVKEFNYYWQNLNTINPEYANEYYYGNV